MRHLNYGLRMTSSQKDPCPEASRPRDWEREIPRLLLQGLSNQQIAVSLGLSEEAVRRHINNLEQKLRQTIRDQS